MSLSLNVADTITKSGIKDLLTKSLGEDGFVNIESILKYCNMVGWINREGRPTLFHFLSD